tara:strand:- start:2768 stop:3415 length:648 start_codon:yes stop_codon:yes gene_type:complete
MKKIVFYLGIIFVGINSISCNTTDTLEQPDYKPVAGDIIFHTSKSTQSPIIQKITKSELSHCGIVYIKNGVPYVFEASSKVKLTKLETFINNGIDKKYEIFRYKSKLSQVEQKNMFQYASDQIGKSYDLKFKFTDDKMYCSELVWKIYKAAGIILSSPTKFKDYDLSSIEAIKMIEDRYGSKINLNEPVITPVQIAADSKNLFPVYQNYRPVLFF